MHFDRKVLSSSRNHLLVRKLNFGAYRICYGLSLFIYLFFLVNSNIYQNTYENNNTSVLNRVYNTLQLSLDSTFLAICISFFYGSRALFTGSTSTNFSKFFFKIGSHGTIHIFKNYFATVFSVFRNKQYPNKPYITKIRL